MKSNTIWPACTTYFKESAPRNKMAYWYKIFLTLLFSFHLSSGDQYDFLSSISISTGINGGKIHSNKTPLFMIGFFPLQEGPMQLLGNVSKLSAELALEHINKNDNILKDFELRMIVKDSKVNTYSFSSLLPFVLLSFLPNKIFIFKTDISTFENVNTTLLSTIIPNLHPFCNMVLFITLFWQVFFSINSCSRWISVQHLLLFSRE